MFMFERTSLFAESWNVAWRKKPSGSILSDKTTMFNIIKNSNDFWAADPFLFSYNGDTYIFAELYDYKLCRGCIGFCKWNGNTFGKWEKVITENYHLSYPFIFEENNEIFIIPESGADKSLYLYRAVDFPYKWERCKTIKTGVIYGDTTLFRYEGKCYALAYDVSSDIYALELISFNKGFESKPITDNENVNLKRPAGKIFFINDEMMRPAQKCINNYGEGLVFYKICFNNGKYVENKVKTVLPNEFDFSKKIILDGMHTYNSNNEFEIIDLKTRRFNLLNFISRIINKIR